ncbi:hypothetical protein BD779DRAFT_1681041 [Infundibulicybe gibba]|nr:hypothetical protein BD779DRAFT_1681041 [Infundibulicybe gibba]
MAGTRGRYLPQPVSVSPSTRTGYLSAFAPPFSQYSGISHPTPTHLVNPTTIRFNIPPPSQTLTMPVPPRHAQQETTPAHQRYKPPPSHPDELPIDALAASLPAHSQSAIANVITLPILSPAANHHRWMDG